MIRFASARRILVLAVLVVAAPACVVRTETVAPSAEVEVTSAPVDVERAPRTVYEGRIVYWFEGRWVFREHDRWACYRAEPLELRRYRTQHQEHGWQPAPRHGDAPRDPRRGDKRQPGST